MILGLGIIYFSVWVIWFASVGLSNICASTYTHQNGRYRKRTEEEISKLKRFGARACLYSFVWPIVVVVALIVAIVDGIAYLFEAADFGGKK